MPVPGTGVAGAAAGFFVGSGAAVRSGSIDTPMSLRYSPCNDTAKTMAATRIVNRTITAIPKPPKPRRRGC